MNRILRIADYLCHKIDALRFAKENFKYSIFQHLEVLDGPEKLLHLEHVVSACALADAYETFDWKKSMLERVLHGLSSMDKSSPVYFQRIKFLGSVIE